MAMANNEQKEKWKFLSRMQVELDELIERKAKLGHFEESSLFQDLDMNARRLMQTQKCIMEAYINILNMRLIDAGGL